jgi:uncharacterized RDD family membrane protein YckC
MRTCPSCGGPASVEAIFCTSCGTRLQLPAEPAEQATTPSVPGPPPSPAAPADVPSAAPPGPAPLEAVSPPPRYASLGDRMLAVFLDSLVLVACFWALGMWIGSRWGGLTAEGFDFKGAPALTVMGGTLIVFLAYCSCLEWWLGATLGKVVAGATVAAAAGGRIDFRQSLLRNVLRLVDGLFFYLVAAIPVLTTRRRQRFGDLLAGTVVLKRDYGRTSRAASVALLLVLPVAAVAGTWSMRLVATERQGGRTATEISPSDGTTTTGPGGTRNVGASSVQLADVSDGPLVLSELRFAEGENGPARPSASFKPGETPTLLFRIRGFATQSEKGRLRLAVSGTDPDGTPIHEPKQQEVQPPSSASSLESWANTGLPDFAIPGDYHLNVAVEDLVAGRKVVVSAPFRVVAAPFEASATLAIRNLHQTEGEDGPPRADTSYRPGATVWMAFDIVGFKSGSDKTVHLRQQLTVTAPSGEKALDAEVLSLDQQYFYVPRRLPITNHVKLGAMPPGDYQVTVAVTDLAGSQRCEQRFRFTIQP